MSRDLLGKWEKRGANEVRWDMLRAMMEDNERSSMVGFLYILTQLERKIWEEMSVKRGSVAMRMLVCPVSQRESE